MSITGPSTRLAVIAATSALVGAIAGALITGYCQLEAQRIAARQAETLESYQASREIGLDYVETAAAYLHDLIYLSSCAGSGVGVTFEAEERLASLNQLTLELSLRSSLETSRELVEANTHVSELLSTSAITPEQEALKSQAIAEAYVAIYFEAARYRLSASPTALRDELITLFLQLGLDGEGK
jgi:hypothetical protein